MNAGETDQRGRGGPGTRLSWWRRAILLVLEVNPPWWGRVTLWLLVFSLMLASGFVLLDGQLRGSRHVIALDAYQAGDAEWRFGTTSQRPINFAVIEMQVLVRSGRRWRTVTPGEVNARIGWADGAAESVHGAQAQALLAGAAASTPKEMLRRYFTDQLDRSNYANSTQLNDFDPALWAEVVKTGRPASRGDAWRIAGVAARQMVLLSLPAALLLVPVGLLRLVQRMAMRRELKLANAGRCPNCGYDMSGRSGSSCPECGTDVEAVEREARAAME